MLGVSASCGVRLASYGHFLTLQHVDATVQSVHFVHAFACLDDAYGASRHVVDADGAVGVGVDVEHSVAAIGFRSLVGSDGQTRYAGDVTVAASDAVELGGAAGC